MPVCVVNHFLSQTPRLSPKHRRRRLGSRTRGSWRKVGFALDRPAAANAPQAGSCQKSDRHRSLLERGCWAHQVLWTDRETQRSTREPEQSIQRANGGSSWARWAKRYSPCARSATVSVNLPPARASFEPPSETTRSVVMRVAHAVCRAIETCRLLRRIFTAIGIYVDP